MPNAKLNIIEDIAARASPRSISQLQVASAAFRINGNSGCDPKTVPTTTNAVSPETSTPLIAASNCHQNYGASEYTTIQISENHADEELRKIAIEDKEITVENEYIIGFHDSNQRQMLQDLITTRAAILSIRKRILQEELARSAAKTSLAKQGLNMWQSLATIFATVAVTIPLGLVLWKVLQ